VADRAGAPVSGSGALQLDLWPGLPAGACRACGSARPDPACGWCVCRRERVVGESLSWSEERAVMRAEREQLVAERARVEEATAQRAERLTGLGRPVRVALVGCGADKREGRHAARDLYVGSLFRAGLGHAEATADEVLIVSAHHHLVELDQEIAAYDRSLASLRKIEREAWAERVVRDLVAHYRGVSVELTFYAGALYVDAIVGALRRWQRSGGGIAWRWSTPLAGLSVGQRLRWYKTARLTRSEARSAA
jgi:hypothetical protein